MEAEATTITVTFASLFALATAFGLGFVTSLYYRDWRAMRGNVADGVLTVRVPCSGVTNYQDGSQHISLSSDVGEPQFTLTARMAKGETMFGLGLRYQVEIHRIE